MTLYERINGNPLPTTNRRAVLDYIAHNAVETQLAELSALAGILSVLLDVNDHDRLSNLIRYGESCQ